MQFDNVGHIMQPPVTTTFTIKEHQLIGDLWTIQYTFINKFIYRYAEDLPPRDIFFEGVRDASQSGQFLPKANKFEDVLDNVVWQVLHRIYVHFKFQFLMVNVTTTALFF
jgi:hypothetical protein